MIENNDMVYRLENTQEATGKILINKEEFDDAVRKVMEKIGEDSRVKGMSGFILVMAGTSFASDMRRILFGEENAE